MKDMLVASASSGRKIPCRERHRIYESGHLGIGGSWTVSPKGLNTERLERLSKQVDSKDEGGCMRKRERECAKIDVEAFAISSGLWWGLGLFTITWWMMLHEGSTGDPTPIGKVYRGYKVSPLGSLIGLAWGAADGLVGGATLAWLYNRLAKRKGN